MAQISELCKTSKQKRAKPGPPQPLPAASVTNPASGPGSQSHAERCSWGRTLSPPCLGVSCLPQLPAQPCDSLSNWVSPLPTQETRLLLLV